ncbi:unnamed protein product [Microthlaspi erraticum]|uniref:Uncharacterized protein n=1 Tax=Microthlaspi erraticum TaxID=1685480 RepID=A0A6D2L1G4_9BRAS|nr:unnamed protein product [Microthlaspi erraticum]
MVLETFLEHKTHHHHHNHNHHRHHHKNSMAEKPNQVMEYKDLSDVMKASSHHIRKVKSERIAKAEDVDKEAENFINLKHMIFSKWI